MIKNLPILMILLSFISCATNNYNHASNAGAMQAGNAAMEAGNAAMMNTPPPMTFP